MATYNDNQFSDLLFEGKLDLMFLPPGAIAWLWKDERPDQQVNSASAIGKLAHGSSPIVKATVLKHDTNVLVLHTANGMRFTVYPDGGIGMDGKPLDLVGVEQKLNGMPDHEANAMNDVDPFEEPDMGPQQSMQQGHEMMDHVGKEQLQSLSDPESFEQVAPAPRKGLSMDDIAF